MKVLIKSKPARFRRAGMEFTTAGVLLNLADLSADQQRILAAEPMLVYSLVAALDESPESEPEEVLADQDQDGIPLAAALDESPESEPEEAFADQDQDGIPDSKDRDADGDGKFESRPKKTVKASKAGRKS